MMLRINPPPAPCCVSPAQAAYTLLIAKCLHAEHAPSSQVNAVAEDLLQAMKCGKILTFEKGGGMIAVPTGNKSPFLPLLFL